MEEYSEKDFLPEPSESSGLEEQEVEALIPDGDFDVKPLTMESDESAVGTESIADETPESHIRVELGGKEPRGKLYAYNWLKDVSSGSDCEYVKVLFKNTRNGFYRNPERLALKIGDMVAVEAAPGHDIGEVVMVGRLVEIQMRKANVHNPEELKRVFRIARPSDLEKYEEAKSREQDTMIRSRKIAEELGLKMKIGDVEYQGDGAKAIFYYIADERVDFRKLIRLLADAFKIRVEMKQIGARQEAGRIGGIGPCGRPLCCASWMSHFASVSTSMARLQDLSMNPQKLAGQCAKLKCCLNFEASAYAESQKKLPHRDYVLQTKDADYYLFKTDPLSRMVTYSTEKGNPANAETISAERAHEIIALNKQGIKVDALSEEPKPKNEQAAGYVDLTDQDSLTRFDKTKRKRKKQKAGGQSGAQGAQGESKNRRGGQPQQKQRQGSQAESKEGKPRNAHGESNRQDGETRSEGRNRNRNRRQGGDNRRQGAKPNQRGSQSREQNQ